MSRGQIRNIPGKRLPSDDDGIRSVGRDQRRECLPDLLPLEPSILISGRDAGGDFIVRKKDPRHADAGLARGKRVAGLERLGRNRCHRAYRMTQSGEAN